MGIKELFEQRKDDSRWNTSYPLSPEDWSAYRVQGPLPFDEDKTLSFYVHIPFCRQLCSFCEYTRMLCPDEELQRAYLSAIANDIRRFKEQYPGIVLQGFDIGGGTPTSLSEDNFRLLMDIYDEALSGLTLTADFEPSIEATFDTLSVAKLERMAGSGIRRLSLGVQSSSTDVLHGHHRKSPQQTEIETWLHRAWGAGIEKVNLDFMYGLAGQTTASIAHDLDLIHSLRPQQVTLYELRTNMIQTKDIPDKETLYAQYCQLYDGLHGMGYVARFGQNTFSLSESDHGVSSYLRHRMLEGASYKGFGISAQSMSRAGVSYNTGKMAPSIRHNLTEPTFGEQFTYLLPPQELASKYLAIAAYNGSFSMKTVEDLGIPKDTFKDPLDFCLSAGLLHEDKTTGKYHITKPAFKHYGAVFSLFCRQRE